MTYNHASYVLNLFDRYDLMFRHNFCLIVTPYCINKNWFLIFV